MGILSYSAINGTPYSVISQHVNIAYACSLSSCGITCMHNVHYYKAKNFDEFDELW